MCHFLLVHHLGIVFLGRVEGQNITSIYVSITILYPYLSIHNSMYVHLHAYITQSLYVCMYVYVCVLFYTIYLSTYFNLISQYIYLSEALHIYLFIYFCLFIFLCIFLWEKKGLLILIYSPTNNICLVWEHFLQGFSRRYYLGGGFKSQWKLCLSPHHTYIYKYIYIYIMSWQASERERDRENKQTFGISRNS